MFEKNQQGLYSVSWTCAIAFKYIIYLMTIDSINIIYNVWAIYTKRPFLQNVY